MTTTIGPENVNESTAIGKFSKGNEFSFMVNFSESGGPQCSTTCRFHPENKRVIERAENGEDVETCYAWRLELIRKALLAAGIRKRNLGAILICNMAILYIAKLRECWIRISAFGSVPSVETIKRTKGLKQALRRFAEVISSGRNWCHWPVESKSKADFYRNEIVNGLGIVIRQSCHSLRQLRNAVLHRSFVVGEKSQSVAQRKREAFKLAADLRENGESVVVCPSIISGAKCGDCKACASDKVDIVLYVLH